MNDKSVPFELIAPLSENLAEHDAETRQRLLADRQLPPFVCERQQTALHYRPSKELLLAINMALHTGSPLLLTGEPGTGKTRAADFVGAYFGIPVHRFVVKSISTAQDLIYEFDAVGYLHWAHATSHQRNQARKMYAVVAEAQAVRYGFLHKRALWRAYEEIGDTVVLIDEIDKAPRDFPNDLLHELDQHSFPHPFAHDKPITPRSGRPPIVIVTSNEERRLPDAFLRRCIFHRIELTEELVEAAVESMARAAGDDERPGFPNLDAKTREVARKRFWDIRKIEGLEKPPSTAELLIWLSILSAQRVDVDTLENTQLSKLPGIGALIKDANDRKRLG